MTTPPNDHNQSPIAVPLSFLASIIGVAIGFLILILNKNLALSGWLPSATYTVDVVFIAWFFVFRHQLRVIFADSLIEDPEGIPVKVVRAFVILLSIISIAGSLLLTILGVHLLYGSIMIIIVGLFYLLLWTFLLQKFSSKKRRAVAFAVIFSEIGFIIFWAYIIFNIYTAPRGKIPVSPNTSNLMFLVVTVTLLVSYEIFNIYWEPLIARLRDCAKFLKGL
jgi:hypothetical protein